MNILLVGEEGAGIQTLKALAQTSHRVVAVMTGEERSASGTATLRAAAQRLGYAIGPSRLVKEPAFADQIRAQGVDVLLNVNSLFRIHPEVLDAPTLGSFNMHPGPLPRYAGLNSVSWAIYRGETTHGVTIHKMVPEVDKGPIAYQTLFPIEEADTGLSVSGKCVKAGIGLVLRLLKDAQGGREGVVLTPQDLGRWEYFGRGIPHEGWLDWARPAREIYNFVRACDYGPFPSPWGRLRADVGGEQVIVARAALTGEPCREAPGTVSPAPGRAVRVACADEWLLVFGSGRPAGRLLPVPAARPAPVAVGSAKQSCPPGPRQEEAEERPGPERSLRRPGAP